MRSRSRRLTPMTANWWLSETLCYLTHLEVTGALVRDRDGDGEPERWELAPGAAPASA